VNNAFTRDLRQALMDANADLVLVGHDHHFERFAPQDANGTLDATKGIREIIVGTGDKTLRPVPQTIANSAVSDNLGVLELMFLFWRARRMASSLNSGMEVLVIRI
jgi:acid phosphatase type 7